ncbi:chromosome partitioning protein [Micromonospora sp. CPCC 205561]|uniref:chromosome partitioning protein n=1 Tax=Micromonospora sp. CPCC 205561 TaxID=3122407 RepID=UPI002FF14658
MPFSLDQPVPPAHPATPGPATAGGPGWTGESAPGPGGPAEPVSTPGGGTAGAGTTGDATPGEQPTDGEGTTGGDATGGSTTGGDGATGEGTISGATGGPVDGGQPGAAAPVGPVTSGGAANGGGRAPAESPWAQPPQRPATAAATAPAAGAADPTPAAQDAATRPVPPGQDAAPHGAAAQAASRHGAETYGPHPQGPQPYGAVQQGAVTGPATGPGPDPATARQAAPPGPYPPQLAGPHPPQPGAPAPSGPYPPGWYPPPWQQVAAGVAAPAPQQAYQPAEGMPAQPESGWNPAVAAPPTAEDFARRRQGRPADPVATMGVRAVANRIGLRLPPGRHEQELRRDIETVRRNFGGLRQVTVVNPKGGAGKTVAILLLAMTFGQKRGGYVLAWDNNETQGTLGMRAQQDFHSRTVRDMLRDLGQFQGAHGRVGDLSQYVRSQGEGMFDVLASDESATGGEMLTAAAFAEIREVVSRFYKLIFVDTGNNVRAQNWQAAMDATDQLVVTMSARNDSAETAARMLDHLEQSGRQRLVRQAVTVVSMPPSRKEIDLPAIQEHFAARTRAVLLAPYERLIDTGEPIRYGGLSAATRDAWLKIAASVAEGL